jgi:hypothetical protein
VAELQAATRDDRARLAALGSTLDNSTAELQAALVPKCAAMLLEKMPNLSVFVLHLPLACAACRLLPWQPSITVREKIHVDIVCGLNASVGAGCNVCGQATISTSLALSTPVEAEKFSASVDPECILIRMPFFYPGSVKTTHGASFVTTAETAALRSNTVPLACGYVRHRG